MKDANIYLNIPVTVWKSTLSREADVCSTACEWYLDNHPARSWRQVADALYRGGRVFGVSGVSDGVSWHTVLEGVKDQVPSLKGESHGVV